MLYGPYTPVFRPWWRLSGVLLFRVTTCCMVYKIGTHCSSCSWALGYYRARFVPYTIEILTPRTSAGAREDSSCCSSIYALGMMTGWEVRKACPMRPLSSSATQTWWESGEWPWCTGACVSIKKARSLDLVWQAKERCPSSSGPEEGACIAHHQTMSVAGASVCSLEAAEWTEQPVGQEKSRLHGAESSRSGCAGPSEESWADPRSQEPG